MKKDAKDLVKDVVNLQQDMNKLTVDVINESAPKVIDTESQTKLSAKERAKLEGVPYIEPIRKLQAIGTLPEKWKKLRERDWEYVKGIFENEVCRGEPITFTFSKWPGDPDCVWQVPANRPVYVPRMIAKHLSGEQDEDTGIKAMEYHSFDYLTKNASNLEAGKEMETFSATGTYSRGKFRSLGAF